MKVLIADTYYQKFLTHFQKKEYFGNDFLYSDAFEKLMLQRFGTSDAYSVNLKKQGIDAQEFVVNSHFLQNKWANERGMKTSRMYHIFPERLMRSKIPFNFTNNHSTLYDIFFEQIKEIRPDIIYVQDISYFSSKMLDHIKKYCRLLVGQIASPLPASDIVRGYDLILTSFPHFVDQIKGQGANSEFFRIGFDDRLLSLTDHGERSIDFSFVGGITRYHKQAVKLLDYLNEKCNLQVYGYGQSKLPFGSRLREVHRGEAWGLDMYRILSKSRITLNRHISTSENYANNMRLFEATGMGALLVTDKKDNISDYFKEDSEIVTYSSAAEAEEKVNYFLQHPEQAALIAKAGQARTLKDHTYETRMIELKEILLRNLKNKL